MNIQGNGQKMLFLVTRPNSTPAADYDAESRGAAHPEPQLLAIPQC
jgi:hypothetical protein